MGLSVEIAGSGAIDMAGIAATGSASKAWLRAVGSSRIVRRSQGYPMKHSSGLGLLAILAALVAYVASLSFLSS